MNGYLVYNFIKFILFNIKNSLIIKINNFLLKNLDLQNIINRVLNSILSESQFKYLGKLQTKFIYLYEILIKLIIILQLNKRSNKIF